MTIHFLCPLASGLHARPASMLAEALSSFASRVTITKDGAEAVDARSVLSVVGLDIEKGNRCTVRADGPDAALALAVVQKLVDGAWQSADESAAAAPSSVQAPLPESLLALAPEFMRGKPACGGTGQGVCVHVGGLSLARAQSNARVASPAEELARAKQAIDQVSHALKSRQGNARTKLERDVLSAHTLMASDPALREGIESHVLKGASAAQAVILVAERFITKLQASSNSYVQDRSVDVHDVCTQLLQALGVAAGSEVPVLTQDSVVCADILTPSQLLQLLQHSQEKLKALVLGDLGATSHTMILARSFSIPSLLGVRRTSITAPGAHVIVDGDRGLVVSASLRTSAWYASRAAARAQWQTSVRSIAQTPGATRDGQALDVAINATTAKEVAAAVTYGAQGVGLLRTELLFLDRDAPPTEDEQFEAYAAVVRAAQPHPVIIRTFDIGGDKPATYMSLPREDNPFLGVRGARLYPAHTHLLHTQLRAILRASSLTTQGAVRIMAPMISVPAEAAWFREQVEFVKAQLSQESIAHDHDVPVGIMIEVPSAAMDIARLAKHADFFSVGTNDLSQYWFAADRGNPHIASIANVREPSFLRLLHTIASQAREAGKWVGVCGEMASDIRNLPIWIGAGFHEISVSPSEVSALKATLATLSSEVCRDGLQQAMQSEHAASAALALAQSSLVAGENAVVVAHAIRVQSTAATKHEAIREAADLMLIAGRTQNPDDIEHAAWKREATYSTSLGFGFAIPHCKTDAVSNATLSVLKLASPISWSEDADVSIVLLLAVPAHDTTGTHMRVFAKLARKLMHEEFRVSLSEATTPLGIAQLLHAACDT